jgi:hypothetical protein
MKRSTPKQRARAGLSLALRNVHETERAVAEHAKALAASKPLLSHARSVLRLATEDARRAGVL